jgi:hypothetical protein
MKHVKQALAGVAMAAALGFTMHPNPVSAEVSGSNTIEIERYHINGAEARRPVTDDEIRVPGELRISFVNRGAVPATDVAFLVQGGGRTTIVHDVGTFSPGVSISHHFVNWDFPSSAKVTVSSVRYADGAIATLPAENGKH